MFRLHETYGRRDPREVSTSPFFGGVLSNQHNDIEPNVAKT